MYETRIADLEKLEVELNKIKEKERE